MARLVKEKSLPISCIYKRHALVSRHKVRCITNRLENHDADCFASLLARSGYRNQL
jgi:hypothetical protein